MLLPISLTIAAACGLITIWLGVRVGRVRTAAKVAIGDGGDSRLIARMRAQANFVEYTPFVLILLVLVELAAGSPLWLWIAGILYVLARIAHAFGMDQPPPFRLRMIGITGTLAILAGLSGYALWLSYTVPAKQEGSVTTLG